MTYSHPYLVIVRPFSGPTKTHRFRHRWQAEGFYAAMVEHADRNGKASTVTLMHGDEVLMRY